MQFSTMTQPIFWLETFLRIPLYRYQNQLIDPENKKDCPRLTVSSPAFFVKNALVFS